MLNTAPERLLKAMPAGRRPPHALRIAVTGFGPFPGVPFNASERLVRDLAKAPPRLPSGARLYVAALPTDWRLAMEALTELMEETRPHVALHFGVSVWASGFVVETRAFNQTSTRPDCSGRLALERCVRRRAPVTVRTKLPAARLVQRLRMEGIAARLSADAGRYLCNAVMFQSVCRAERGSSPQASRAWRQEALSAVGGNIPDLSDGPMAGFVHIPALGSDAAQHASGFGWPELRRGADVILDTLARLAHGRIRQHRRR